jgi:flavin reductase (DIM6/NTAB) family NADH-FMN oxidoreductase RutF
MASMQIDPATLDKRATYRLMISCIVPRPIAWVSTRSPDGVLNAAPFSYFQALGGAPPMIMIAVGNRRTGEPKDTRRNIEATGEFVVNILGEAAGPQMVRSSVDHPYGVSEFDEVGITAVASERVAPPRIGECGIALECKLDRVLELGGSGVVIGEVVLFHVEDGLLDADGLVDPARLNPLGRLGGNSYAPVREIVAMDQAGEPVTEESPLFDLWGELRDRSIAMVAKLAPEQLASSVAGMGASGMCVGRMFRHMAACTAHRVLEWEGRGDEDALREWDVSWTGERIAAELAADRDLFLAACRTAPRADLWKVGRMIRHEAWHQGQIALILRAEFGESELWRM